ncbi:nitroreductase/quinone reductase family protein [Jatrophihabitans sp.]|uniref:nitroreductase/quinone reductase family protein n=1 Tax=Jatrophihabitans sp. TaxID=1932789 RepID=UPI0030C6FD51|nr:deazaflavin-dependent nitroreductase [Jatrophihabitans sp.]
MAGLQARARARVAGAFSRVMRTRPMQRYFAPFFPGLQMRLYRWSGGRFQLSALLVPSLVLVHLGARSGLRRETPLICWPQRDGSYLIAGSNWGQPSHPAWTGNVLAHPDVEIVIARRHVAVTAVLLSGDERERAWPVLEAQWPGYRDYERQAGREVRIFRLVPRA